MSDFRAMFADRARDAARAVGIDEHIFLSLIDHESGFNPFAESGDGAIGIAQIIPRWHPGVNPRDPNASLQYAAQLLRNYLDIYGEYEWALAAYNVGNSKVALWTYIPEWELQRYVRPILWNADASRVIEKQDASAPFTETPTISYVATPTPIPEHIATPTPTPPAIMFMAALVLAVMFRR